MEVSIFNENYVKRNSLRAWVLAARPKTLTAAAVPVMLGSAYAWHVLHGQLGTDNSLSTFGWVPMVLCFLFAFVMQIDANFVNDYYDCVRKKDNEKRLGPERACQQGWVTLKAMRWAMGITTALACCVGLPLLWYGGWEMLIVGAACVVFCFLYTTLFASLGLGDLLVLVFFGLVPVMCTYWVIMPHDADAAMSLTGMEMLSDYSLWLLAAVCGLVVDTLLIINNYRDIDNDREVGKRTLVVMMGRKAAEWLYVILPTIALVTVLCLFGWSSENLILMFGVYYLNTGTWYTMKQIGKGKALNKVLGMTARNIFAFGVLTTIVVILS